jgi:CRISPR-associated protein Cmr2
MDYLFLMSIGPVQEFIASARRSRDLWFSSWLLSELSKTAARTLRDEFPGTRLIFPNPPQAELLANDSAWNVANNIVALIQQSPQEVGEKIEKALHQRLMALWQRAFQRIGKPSETLLDVAMADAQIADLLECQWTAVPLQGNYPQARRQALALLAARKATRTFAAVPWEQRTDIPKSSLDGKRESVIREDMYDKLTPNELYRRVRARKAERLSAVDLLKRLGVSQPLNAVPLDLLEHFPSTSHMAALPFLVRLQHDQNRGKIESLFAQLLKSLGELKYQPERIRGRDYTPSLFAGYDGSFLFESRLREAPEEFDIPEENVTKAVAAVRYFIRESGRGQQPSPYYALLVADGDRMGAAIDAQPTVETHQQISLCMSNFAGSVKRIVEAEHQGALIYAGGDDVMAFLPLHTALACARKLSLVFAEVVCAFPDRDGKTPTLSAGLAICHHLEPLSDALATARNAEKAAKRVSGKNALAITLAKRGGADRTIADQWEKLYPRLQSLIAAHRQDEIPDGAAYQLRDLHNRLTYGGGKNPTLEVAMRAEAGRILARKRSKRGQTPIADGLRSDMTNWLAAHQKLPNDERVYALNLAQLADELIIAAEFAKAEELAALPLAAPVNA